MRQDYKISIEDLKGEREGEWNVQLLIQLFGHVNAVRIVAEVKAPSLERGEDRLIFKPTKNGNFSVAKAYNCLRSGGVGGGNLVQQEGTEKEFWRKIWK